jgi:hypothetical protein
MKIFSMKLINDNIISMAVNVSNLLQSIKVEKGKRNVQIQRIHRYCGSMFREGMYLQGPILNVIIL